MMDVGMEIGIYKRKLMNVMEWILGTARLGGEIWDGEMALTFGVVHHALMSPCIIQGRYTYIMTMIFEDSDR